jgi:hypothetical protein
MSAPDAMMPDPGMTPDAGAPDSGSNTAG